MEDNKFSCDEFWGELFFGIILKEGYILYLFIFEYFFFLVIIGIVYGKMVMVLYCRDEGFEGRKLINVKIKVNYKKFIWLLIVLIVSFVFCYFFNYVLFFWFDYGIG